MKMILPFVLLLLSCSPKTSETVMTIPVADCGVERWAIKCLSDKDTAKINFDSVTCITVDSLTKIPKTSIGKNSERQPSEMLLYKVTAAITDYKKEDDGDIHIVLQDTATGATMIAEMPNPECENIKGTSRAAKYAETRQWLTDHIGNPTTSFKHISFVRMVTVTGVAFFDFAHGQRGLAPNSIELHPILSIE